MCLRGSRSVWMVALIVLLATAARAAVCPPAAERTQLQGQAASTTTGSDNRALWQRLLEATRACSDPATEAAVLASWTNFSANRGDTVAALESENSRYSLAAHTNLRLQRADAAARLGILLTERGEMDLAERRLNEASTELAALGELSQAADVYSRLSRFHRRSGDYLAALGDEQTALSLRRRMTPPPNVWRSLLNLAVLYEQLEQVDEARRRYAEALDEAELEGVDKNIAIVLNSFAGFLNDFGAVDAPQALSLAERALAIDRRHDPSSVQVASGLLQTARAQMNLGHFDLAEQSFREGLDLARQFKHPAMHAHLTFRYGELALARSELQTALERVNTARVDYEALGNRHRLVKVQAVLEEIYAKLGEPLMAANAGREQFRLRDELLGSKASGKISELLTRFELNEERLRNERLAQEKALAELNALNDRRGLQVISAVAIAVGLGLVLLGWRHVTVQRLYRALRASNDLVQAQALQLAQNNAQLTQHSERLYRTSVTDALTGIGNRGFAMSELRQRLQELASGHGIRTLSLLLLDIDFFKQVNDRHGHPAGDQVLIAVAGCLRELLPEAGVLGRVGGEEFMVLIADRSCEAARELAEKLRLGVSELVVDIDSATGESEGPTAHRSVRVSVSIGVCNANPGQTLEQVYAIADQALYRAKQEGRNCVRAGS